MVNCKWQINSSHVPHFSAFTRTTDTVTVKSGAWTDDCDHWWARSPNCRMVEASSSFFFKWAGVPKGGAGNIKYIRKSRWLCVAHLLRHEDTAADTGWHRSSFSYSNFSYQAAAAVDFVPASFLCQECYISMRPNKWKRGRKKNRNFNLLKQQPMKLCPHIRLDGLHVFQKKLLQHRN